MLHLKTKTKRLTLVKSLLFALLLGAPLAASAQDVEINETNFPDENFRDYLRWRYYGKDGVITEEEINSITLIDISYEKIRSLKGIEHFTALEYLWCYCSQLTTLDVSGCTALTNLQCQGSQLTTLDVSGCTALTYLDCYDNQLTTLDVSGCTALTDLNCHFNQLTALNVSGCTALTSLSCSENQLTTLDVSGYTALTRLDCYDNQLTTLDVSGCTALTYLCCWNNQLTALDVSNNTALTYLDCYNNQIKGASMDALINSLPTSGGSMRVCNNSEGDEGNVCTKTQVEAIKAKGWIPYYYDSTRKWWKEYEGYDEATGIAQPATATTDANEPVYTLSGQKVNNGSLKGKKGVYIIGGKKVVVK